MQVKYLQTNLRNRSPQPCCGHTYKEHQHQLSDAEADAAVVDALADGLSLQTNLGGYGGSSTRAEVAAGILALGSTCPTHIGTDSASFLAKATHIHHLILTNKAPRRPWSLQVDGDLWHTYWLHAKSNGAAKGSLLPAQCSNSLRKRAGTEKRWQMQGM